MTTSSAEAQRDLLQFCQLQNEHKIKRKQKVRRIKNKLNELKKQQEDLSQNDRSTKLREIEEKLLSKQQRTKGLYQRIEHIKDCYKEQTDKIDQYKARTQEIEKEMNEQHDLQISQLRECAMALSDLNEKLFYLTIDQLLRSKSAQSVDEYIEKVTLQALKRMQCPDETAKNTIRTNKVFFDYSVKRRNETESAKRLESTKEERTSELRKELDALNREIDGLKTQRMEKDKRVSSWNVEQQELEGRCIVMKEKVRALELEQKSVEERVEENQRVLAKEMDEHIVKQRVFQQNKRFKQMLEEKRDDPDFADSKLMPFCDEGWTVGDVKKYIDIYEQKFTEHCKLIQWLTFDNLVERCKSAMEQGDEDLMMDLNDL